MPQLDVLSALFSFLCCRPMQMDLLWHTHETHTHTHTHVRHTHLLNHNLCQAAYENCVLCNKKSSLSALRSLRKTDLLCNFMTLLRIMRCFVYIFTIHRTHTHRKLEQQQETLAHIDKMQAKLTVCIHYPKSWLVSWLYAAAAPAAAATVAWLTWPLANDMKILW